MKKEEFIKDLRENPSKYHYKVTWFILAKGKSRHDFEEIETKLKLIGLLDKVNGKKWIFDKPLIEITVARDKK